MSDKELIKQEIERRIVQAEEFAERAEGANDDSSKLSWDFAATQNKSLLQFINSLPEEPSDETTKANYNERYKRIAQTEQFKESYCGKLLGKEEPASEDLRKELDNFLKDSVFGKLINRNAGIALVRHFAEWGRNHFEDKNEMVSEDLEEKITKCYKSQNGLMMTRKQFGEIIHRFTEWQKQKDLEALQIEYEKGLFDMREAMMKDAVEGRVQCGYGDGNKLSIKAMLPQDSDLKYADKVKVLILKTE